jgi:predicted ATP-dependent endonuclease of OLD family
VEACCTAGIEGLVVLVEEPELFLGPQAQRYLYRVLHQFAGAGNQVLYSTHAPEFLNVARLEELALVERDPRHGTAIVQPESLPADEEFRAMSEFDAERSELFLSRAAVLVEGLTEKLALPFVFAALGQDPDQEGISIVECGGKSNIPLFARICQAARIPFVVLHDRDVPTGTEPSPAEEALNDLIARVAGSHRTVVLEPDFEAVAGLRGHKGKPHRAWQRFRSLRRSDVPLPLGQIVETAVGLARGHQGSYLS